MQLGRLEIISERHNCVSSAKICELTYISLRKSSFIIRENRKGPKTEPCGKPLETRNVVERWPLTLRL